MASAVEGISNAMDSFMTRPQMTPADATASLTQISQALVQGGAAAAANGAPAAAATAGSMVGVMNAANVALTTTWTTASVVPGGQPAANIAYTEGIKAAAAAAASAVLSAMAGISDMHTCPVPVPAPPHGPGFVTRGSSTVNIGNLPAARMGDRIFEACGGQDPIAIGCPTVNIGDGGGGDGAGALAYGLPGIDPRLDLMNEMYPPIMTVRFGEHIIVQGSPEFVMETMETLSNLSETMTGTEIIDAINGSGNDVTIVECPPGSSQVKVADPASPDLLNGTGTDATVYWDNDQSPIYNSGAKWDNPPKEVELGHELIHAAHVAEGDMPGDTRDPEVQKQEEARTVGLPANEDAGLPDNSEETMTEKNLRDDLNQPPRTSYNDPRLNTW
jgi:uncharacterized Zn-binding protein involved in type VI secretion